MHKLDTCNKIHVTKTMNTFQMIHLVVMEGMEVVENFWLKTTEIYTSSQKCF